VNRAIAAGAMILLLPLAAAAQSGGAATPASQGPMVVERVQSGFLVAPDIKVTQVDGKTSELAGVYAGWLNDETIFIGGGGYWMANQSSDRQMAYGGLVLQWVARTNDRFGFGIKSLLGGGQATLTSNVTQILPVNGRELPFDGMDRGAVTNARIRFREGFFVAEPGVDLLVRLTRHVRLTGGASYRFVGAEGRDDNRLRGATGSLGLQIGGGL
jgi:hypothetical protein